MAELRGWSRFVGLQVPYSLLQRDVERAELLMAQHWDMAVMPWGILRSGLLTGKYSTQNSDPKRMGAQEIAPEVQKVIDAVQDIANESGRTPTQVAVNWVRQQQHRAQIIPILGARTLAQLEDNLAALEWQLSDDQLQRLDDISRIPYGFPRDFMEGARQYIFGRTFPSIDNHRGWPAK